MYNLIFNRLKSEENPIDLILVGLGFMGHGFLQFIKQIPGIRVILLVSRDFYRASNSLTKSGLQHDVADNPAKIKTNSEKGILSICSDYKIISEIDCHIVMEMTGEISYGTQVALETLNSGKHLATMNCELQVTLGTELKAYADDKNLNITEVQGDQPGSLASFMNELKLYGFEILMAGNLKGFLNRYATPNSLVEEAAKRGISWKQVTSFTDGTKIAFEMALVANYFGMEVLKPGMYGHPVDNLNDILPSYDWKSIPENGCVDYVIGLHLPAGIFMVGKHQDIQQSSYLNYLKLGNGPYYMLYRPFHLCHLEAPLSIARLSYFNEITINNSLNPTTQVVAFAKRDLKIGDKCDGIGGSDCYGLLYNLPNAKYHNIVPIGLVEDAIIESNVKKDEPIRFDDIALPENEATRFLKLVDIYNFIK